MNGSRKTVNLISPELKDVLPAILSYLRVNPVAVSHCFIYDRHNVLTPNNLQKLFTIAMFISVASACKQLYSQVVDLLKSFKFDPLPHLKPEDFLCAAFSLVGELELLKWARNSSCKTTAVCANACAGGHEEIIKWLVDEGMDFSQDNQCCPSASTNGRLNILVYLVDGLKLPLSSQCFSDAIDFGHLNILNYLIQNKCPEDPKAYARAAYNKQIRVLELLKLSDIICNYNVTGPAADVGDIVTLDWLKKNNFPFDYNTCSYAARKGHLKVVQWLYENGAKFGTNYCETAIKFNQWKCLIYGLENNSPVTRCIWDRVLDPDNKLEIPDEDRKILNRLYQQKEGVNYVPPQTSTLESR